MISTFDVIVYCAISAMMVLLLMALGIAVSMPMIDRWSKRFFIISILLLILCVIICLFDKIIYLNPDFVTEEKIIAYLEAFFTSILIILPTILLLSDNLQIGSIMLLRKISFSARRTSLC